MNPSTIYVRSPEQITRRNARLLLVDLQEKLVPVIDGPEQLLMNCRLLAEGARLLGLPIDVTEQYPKGLGKTVAQVSEFAARRIEKLRFSAAEAVGWPSAAAVDDDRFQVILAGIETHVCVQQTALDLLAMGYQVFVAVDAVASHECDDHKAALERMKGAGATLTTVESILFEACELAGTPEFKQLSTLVKTRRSRAF